MRSLFLLIRIAVHSAILDAVLVTNSRPCMCVRIYRVCDSTALYYERSLKGVWFGLQ